MLRKQILIGLTRISYFIDLTQDFCITKQNKMLDAQCSEEKIIKDGFINLLLVKMVYHWKNKSSPFMFNIDKIINPSTLTTTTSSRHTLDGSPPPVLLRNGMRGSQLIGWEPLQVCRKITMTLYGIVNAPIEI